MPETKIVSTGYGVGGHDTTKPNNNIIEQVTKVVSDAELDVEKVGFDADQVIKTAISAFKSWATLTPAQKDRILKGLLADFIVRRR